MVIKIWPNDTFIKVNILDYGLGKQYRTKPYSGIYFIEQYLLD
jgi:hypothetical protein